MKPFLLLLLAVGAALGQAVTPSSALPQYFVSAGASYNRYATGGPIAAGWMDGAIRMNASGLYSLTTIDMTSTSSSLRTGLAQVLKRTGNFILLAHADGGITVGTVIGAPTSATLGSFSGGAAVMYDLGGIFSKLKGQGIYAVGVVRLMAISGASVQPVFEFGFGKGF